MVHQPIEAQHLQFECSIPLSVRKTFVHYDEEIEVPDLRRGSTAPAQVARADDSDSDWEEDDEIMPKLAGACGAEGALEKPEHACTAASLTASGDGGVSVQLEAPDALVPGPQAICRHTTFDVFEHWEGEAWLPPQGDWVEQTADPQMGREVMLPVMASDTAMSTGMFPAAWVPICLSPGFGFFGVPQPMEWSMQPSNEWLQQAGICPPGPVPVEAVPPAAPSNPILAQLQGSTKPGKEDEDEDFLKLSLPVQAQKLVRTLGGVSNGFDRAYWIVDAKKLKSNNKVVVSPAFEVSVSPTCKVSGVGGHTIILKMVMYPPTGCNSFKLSGGKGYVQLKCESDTQHFEKCPLSFRLGISSGYGDEKWQAARGPVTWDFAKSVICDLEEATCKQVQRDWDFAAVAVNASQTIQTFAVCLEILPSSCKEILPPLAVAP